MIATPHIDHAPAGWMLLQKDDVAVYLQMPVRIAWRYSVSVTEGSCSALIPKLYTPMEQEDGVLLWTLEPTHLAMQPLALRPEAAGSSSTALAVTAVAGAGGRSADVFFGTAGGSVWRFRLSDRQAGVVERCADVTADCSVTSLQVKFLHRERIDHVRLPVMRYLRHLDVWCWGAVLPDAKDGNCNFDSTLSTSQVSAGRLAVGTASGCVAVLRASSGSGGWMTEAEQATDAAVTAVTFDAALGTAIAATAAGSLWCAAQ